MFEPILDCPCCGAEAEKIHIVQWEHENTRDAQDEVGVRCTSCPLNILFKGNMYSRLDERAEFAIDLWNKRTPDPKGILMNRKDKEAFKKLIDELRVPQAMAYTSNPEYEEGIDYGRDDSADRIEELIKKLTPQ